MGTSLSFLFSTAAKFKYVGKRKDTYSTRKGCSQMKWDLTGGLQEDVFVSQERVIWALFIQHDTCTANSGFESRY